MSSPRNNLGEALLPTSQSDILKKLESQQNEIKQQQILCCLWLPFECLCSLVTWSMCCSPNLITRSCEALCPPSDPAEKFDSPRCKGLDLFTDMGPLKRDEKSSAGAPLASILKLGEEKARLQKSIEENRPRQQQM